MSRSGDSGAGEAGTTGEVDTEAAHAAALASLPGIGPAGLVAILREHPPVAAWEEVRAGRLQRPAPRGRRAADGADTGVGQAALFGPGPPVVGAARSSAASWPSWAEAARRVDPVRWWSPFASAGIGVTWPGRRDYPTALAEDPQPPGVLFWSGRIGCLERLCVAIVGTRNATPDGRAVAFEMGRDLAAAGVCVVSGLALGIDGAAHAGAVAAVAEGAPGATVGVAASGVDVPYPRRHAGLWREVVSAGAVISENLPGRPAQAWRFPSRNRVIAGLARLVVVVESHACGGSLITAEAAMERGVEVRVVPGPVHSPASAGSNQLLYDGPGPVRHAQDVLDALGVLRPAVPPAPTSPPSPRPPLRGPSATAGTSGAVGPARPPTGCGPVLEAMGWRPVSTGQVMARTGLGPAAVVKALDALREAGEVSEEAGWWVRLRPPG